MRKPRTGIEPAEYDPIHAYAIKALAEGNATEEQQRLALDWIINHAAMTYDQSFWAGSADVTAFREGKRSVGNQIVKLIKLKSTALQDE